MKSMQSSFDNIFNFSVNKSTNEPTKLQESQGMPRDLSFVNLLNAGFQSSEIENKGRLQVGEFMPSLNLDSEAEFESAMSGEDGKSLPGIDLIKHEVPFLQKPPAQIKGELEKDFKPINLSKSNDLGSALNDDNLGLLNKLRGNIDNLSAGHFNEKGTFVLSSSGMIPPGFSSIDELRQSNKSFTDPNSAELLGRMSIFEGSSKFDNSAGLNNGVLLSAEEAALLKSAGKTTKVDLANDMKPPFILGDEELSKNSKLSPVLSQLNGEKTSAIDDAKLIMDKSTIDKPNAEKLMTKGDLGFLKDKVSSKVWKEELMSQNMLQKLSDGQARVSDSSIEASRSLRAESPTTAMTQPQLNTVATSHLSMVNGELVKPDASQEIKSQSAQSFSEGLNLKSKFTPDLSMRIQWMLKQSMSSAEILMDPPELGPLTVKVQQHNGETTILFQVNNASTKEALDENMAKLKEMLQEQGIALGDTQVKQNNDSPESEQSASEDETNSLESLNKSEEELAESTSLITSEGIVDLYS